MHRVEGFISMPCVRVLIALYDSVRCRDDRSLGLTFPTEMFASIVTCAIRRPIEGCFLPSSGKLRLFESPNNSQLSWHVQETEAGSCQGFVSLRNFKPCFTTANLLEIPLHGKFAIRVSSGRTGTRKGSRQATKASPGGSHFCLPHAPDQEEEQKPS